MDTLTRKVNELRTNLATGAGLDAETMADLAAIDLKVSTGYTLADAIREGSTVSDQAFTWGDGETACALTAAVMAARARGYIS